MSTLGIVQYGTQTIQYELCFAARKTMAIQVRPDLTVSVVAPQGTDPETVQNKVYKRSAWIVRQLRKFELYLPDVPPRQYVSGESHRYLGRQYRLKVLAEDTDVVRLSRQFLEVATPAGQPVHVKELVQEWYQQKAEEIFQERLIACHSRVARFGITLPRISIRRMNSSWGTCNTKGAITLNIKLIQVPLEYIDCVIVHELCHLKYLNHGPDFLKLLTRSLPDWQTRRDKLNHYDFG